MIKNFELSRYARPRGGRGRAWARAVLPRPCRFPVAPAPKSPRDGVAVLRGGRIFTAPVSGCSPNPCGGAAKAVWGCSQSRVGACGGLPAREHGRVGGCPCRVSVPLPAGAGACGGLPVREHGREGGCPCRVSVPLRACGGAVGVRPKTPRAANRRPFRSSPCVWGCCGGAVGVRPKTPRAANRRPFRSFPSRPSFPLLWVVVSSKFFNATDAKKIVPPKKLN